MDWNNLKVALAISRTGSLTRAAQVLGVDTSTAGRRLSTLEADLGVPLFVRTKAGFALTDAGESAINRVMVVQNQISSLVDDVTESNDGPVGTVRLFATGWVIKRLTQTTLASFLQENPQIDLRTLTRPPDNMVRGDASLSLWFETEPRDGAFTIALGKIPYAVYRARNLEHDPQNWVAFQDELSTCPLLERANRRLRQKEKTLRFTATDADILMAAIKEGLGQGLLPMCIAEADAELVRVNPGEPDLERVIYAHAYHDTVQTLRIQSTIRWLRESFDRVFREF